MFIIILNWKLLPMRIKRVNITLRGLHQKLLRYLTVIYRLNNTISIIKTVIFYIKIVDSDIPSLPRGV